MDEALAASRALVVEMLDDADSRSAFETAARLPPGRSLRTLAGPERFERVASRLSARYGLPAAATERLTPWAAYLTLSQPPRPQGEIVDAALQRIARQRGLPVVPLETAREQIASIAAVQTGHMLALLEAQARRHDETIAAIDTLLARYLEEDLDGMLQNEELALRDEPALRPAYSDLFEQILVRRSARMVERMRPRLERGGAFVAIGALHLHGEQGVLALLERAGWQVRRVERQRR
ncbi:TraB family protein [Methylibium sp. T29-B]|nr:TraB family protein [Methylibium sp. T29-B]